MSTETEARPTIEAAELGCRFDLTELSRCTAIYGFVAWPGKKNPGFAVVIGMIYSKMYLLAEYESSDIRDLIYKCGVLSSDFCFNIAPRGRRWYGDYENPNAADFIQEMNQKNKDCPFTFYGSSDLSERDEPYSYLLPKLKGYLETSKKRLFLKESKVREYLMDIERNSQPSALELGDYPAIEAVAIAAIKLQREYDRILNHGGDRMYKSAWGNNTQLLGLPRCSQRQI